MSSSQGGKTFLVAPEFLIMVANSEKEHLSIVICGHVDSGKSTTTGRLIFELGGLPERELEKLKAEAERLGKGSFAFAFLCILGRRLVPDGGRTGGSDTWCPQPHASNLVYREFVTSNSGGIAHVLKWFCGRLAT